VPVNFLTDEYFLSWAPGTSEATPTANGSPAFVTPIYDETVIFVDYSPTDGIIDQTVTRDRLETLLVFDPDNNNTGMHIFANGPIAVAWGQDPDTAGTGNPYLDLGTANLPMPPEWIDLTLGLVKSADPTVLAPVSGKRTTFTVNVITYDFPVADIAVEDLLPPGFSYVNNTAIITLPGGTTISGGSANPAISGQTLTWDNATLNNLDMEANETLTITYDVEIDGTVVQGQYTNMAQASGSRLLGSQVFSPFDSAIINVTPLVIDKDSITKTVSGGGTAQYTIRIENISEDDASGITVTDDLPAGFTFASTDSVATTSGVLPLGPTLPTTVPSPGDTSLTWGPWFIDSQGEVLITFTVNVGSAVVPDIYDNSASASGTWDGAAISFDDKGEVEQDLGTPSGEDPADDEDVEVVSLLLDLDTTTPTVGAGGQATYVIVVENSGSTTISAADISAFLPAGFTYASTTSAVISDNGPAGDTIRTITSNPGVGDTFPQWGTWDIGPGDLVTITFNADVAGTVSPGTYDTSAFVNSSQTGLIDDAGPVAGDAHTLPTDTGTDEDVTVETAVLTIDKDATVKYAVRGSTTVTWEIKIVNTGSADAMDVVIADSLPAGFSFNSNDGAPVENLATRTSTSDPTFGDTSLSWGTWTIQAGGSVTLRFIADVDVSVAAGTYDNTASLTSTQTGTVDDIGTIGQDTGTPPLEDPEEDEDVTIFDTPTDNLAIAISHTEDDNTFFIDYLVDVSNSGPSPETGPLTVTVTLPTGIDYLGTYGGALWTFVSQVGQDLTFSYSGGVAVGASASTLTINTEISATTTPVNPIAAATVSGALPDYDLTNNTDVDPVAPKISDLSTSTKTVLDLNGGDVEPGDVLEYTITLIETGDKRAKFVAVTDDIPPNINNFTVTLFPTTPYTDDSTFAGTGANGTGFLDINNFDLPKSSTMAIKFQVTVDLGVPDGTTIDNQVIIDNPRGFGAAPAAPTLIVRGSTLPGTGSKPLYLYDNQDLSRTVPTTAQGTLQLENTGNLNTGDPPVENVVLTLTPATQQELRINGTSGNIPLILWLSRIEPPGNTWRRMYMRLDATGAVNAHIGTFLSPAEITDMTTTAQQYNFAVPIDTGSSVWNAGTSEIVLPAGTAITLTLASYQVSGVAAVDRDVAVHPDGDLNTRSQVLLNSNTIVQVDNVSFYDAVYPGGSTVTTALPGTTVYIRGTVSDPFGFADITGATLDLVDSLGTIQVNDGVMTEVANNGAESKTYEYAYTFPVDAEVDNWTAFVTAAEGSEGTVTDIGLGVITVTTVSGADLSISKTHTDTFTYDQNGTFNIRVSNNGPEDQTADIVVTDTIPAGMTYVSSTGTGWSVNTAANPIITWTYPASPGSPVAAGFDLPPIAMTVLVGPSGTTPSTIQNTATVDPGVGENNPSNDSATDTVNILAVGVSKTVNVTGDYYYAGDNTDDELDYTITVTNSSDGVVRNVQVTDILPVGVTFENPPGTEVTAPDHPIRVTEYYIGAGEFTGTTYELVLNHDLKPHYFVIVQGSAGDGTSTGNVGPDENYAAITADPFGTGDLDSLSRPDAILLTRGNVLNDWVGVVTVVESLKPGHADAFQLLDVVELIQADGATTGTDNSAIGWSDINQVVLFGSMNGAGCLTAVTSNADMPTCFSRLYPSLGDQINWTRDAGGATLGAAVTTVMVTQWGGNWNVQRVRVQGTNGGNGANAVGEYNTAAITAVTRANTWVWGTGHTDDNGIGDGGEGVLITLGDGVNQNASESTVAVGTEYGGTAVDFEVYTLTHPEMAVDYRFKPDGDSGAVSVDVTVDDATGWRMAHVTNGQNGTGNAYPRPLLSAHYVADDTARLERTRSGQNFPVWVQGINFSGMGAGNTVTAPGNPPPGLVIADDGYSLLPGESLTVTFTASIDNPLSPGPLFNTVQVTADGFTDTAVATAAVEVRTLGVPNFTDATGTPIPSIDWSAGEEVFVQVADLDRNEDPTTIESLQVTVTNPDTADSVVMTLYETGANTGVFVNKLEVIDPASNANPGAIETVTVTTVNSVTGFTDIITLYETGPNTGIFANDSDGRPFAQLPLVSCADPEINCCSALLDGCGTVTPPTAAETLYVEAGTTPQLQLNYADPADPGRDNASAQVFIATQVVLSDFGACRQADQSIVYWETASEVGTAAFNLLRLNTATGDYEPVNERPVPSLLGHLQGGIYRLADPGVAQGDRVTYQLEEIESRGKLNRYGPFTVTVGTAPDKVAALGAMTADFHRDAHPPNGLPQTVTRTFAALRFLAAPTPGDALKISITTEGLYYLSAVQIADLLTGMTEADVITAIGLGNLALTRNGSLVPYLPAAANAGLYFYGTGSDSLYTASNYYWLRPGTGLLMEPGDAVGDVTGTGGVDAPDVAAALKTVDGVIVPGVRPDYAASGADVNGDARAGLPEALYGLQALEGVRTPADNSGDLQPSASVQSFAEILHLEQNFVPLTDRFNDPAVDYWSWNYMIAEGDERTINNVTDVRNVNDLFSISDDLGSLFTLQGWSGQGSINMTVHLFGTNDDAADSDHHVVVTLNGTPVGEAKWNGVNAYTLEINDIDPVAIGFQNDGTDFFTLQANKGAGVTFSRVVLDAISIEYPRTMVAVGNHLALQGDNHTAVTVSGFSSTGIQVLDVGDPDRPRLITTTRVDDSAGNYRVTFEPFTDTSPYYVVVSNTASVPPVVTAVNDTDLRDTGNAYEYLVIAPATFTTAAQELVDYRIAQGLTGRVVAWTDIVDEFNHGIPGPEAIRVFLQYAIQNWAQAPQYVVLAGNGTYDYKNTLAINDNYIPALMTGTPDGLFASDQLLADVSGNDGVPDMALGRLPATSAAELTAMINQIKAFENGSGPWRQRALMVAGSQEYAGETSDFKADSAGVAGRLPLGFDTSTVYQEDGGTNVDVIGQLNAGTLLVNYIGHGGYDRLAGVGLLTLNDLPSLTNAGQRPLLAALTCIVGNFALPGIDALGEALVKWPTGGAIAVWAPTGLSVNAKAVWLNEEFADQMTNAVGTDTRLGDLILNALRDYHLNSGDKFLVGLYNLLGDPALIMPLADLDTRPD